MSFKRSIFIFMLLPLLLMLILPITAQEEPQVIVEGLLSPRNLTFDSAGNLYIAEAGNGGPYLTSSDTPFGASSRVTMVTPDGEAQIILQGLLSYREGDSLGINALHITDESIWMLIGETGDFRIPFTHALVELNRSNNRVRTFVDLLTFELENDPDGNPNQEVNPVDFEVMADGSILIALAGCNCVVSWTEATGVQLFAAWEHATDNPVPTSVESDAAGNIYIAFLTGFPYPPGGSRVEMWTNGELAQTFTGLTTVTGLYVTDDGTIYAVETGMQGPGRVVHVTEGGPVPILEGLNAPYGIAQGPDGRLYVSVGAFGPQEGSVIALPAMTGG